MTINDKLNLILRMQLCQMTASEACADCPYKGMYCRTALIAAATQAIQEHAVNDEKDLEGAITKILLELGAAQGYAGWKPTVVAAKLVAEDPRMTMGVTKVLYPTVGKICGMEAMHVERNIRHLVERALIRSDYETIVKYFGNSIHPDKGKPTVREFIARIADAANRQIADTHG